jgi:hypothetical protein
MVGLYVMIECVCGSHVWRQAGVNGPIAEDILVERAIEQQALRGIQVRQKLTAPIAISEVYDDRRLQEMSLSSLPDLPTSQRVLRELHGFCGVQQDEDDGPADGPAAQIRAGYLPSQRRRLSVIGLDGDTLGADEIYVKGFGVVKRELFCNKHRLFSYRATKLEKGLGAAVGVSIYLFMYEYILFIYIYVYISISLICTHAQAMAACSFSALRRLT